jgi:hypothetical protein
MGRPKGSKNKPKNLKETSKPSKKESAKSKPGPKPKRRRKKADPNLVGPVLIGALGNLNERTIRKKALNGELLKTSSGEYNLKHAFNHFLEKELKGVVSNSKLNEGAIDTDDDEIRLRHDKAKADLAELEVDIERRVKMDLSTVQAFIGSEVATFKRELLGLPRGLPNELYGLDEEAIQQRLREIFDQMLLESDERFNYSALMEYLDT